MMKSHLHFKVLVAVMLGVGLILAGCSPSETADTGTNVTNETVTVETRAQTPVSSDGEDTQGWETEWSRDLGIKLLETYDSSGEPAWNAEEHPLVFITSEGPGYGGLTSDKVSTPGLTLIDAETREVIVTRHYDLGYEQHYEPHGLGVSPDGQWIYLPTADATYDLTEGDTPGRWLVIDAKTLKVHQIIGTRSVPHHAKSYIDPNGNPRVLATDFNWQIGDGIMRPGSGTYTFDPANDNRVVGGINAAQLQSNPYLAFASKDATEIYIGMPPGPISDPDINHHLEGMVAVVDALTWQPKKYYKAGYDPIWTAFSSDNQYAYVCDGGSDEVFKIDRTKQSVVGTSRSSVHGVYGCHFGWDDKELWTIEKGESSHNRGKNIGLVDTAIMAPVNNWNTGWIRADHGTVHPDPEKDELWVTANSSFEVVVWDMGAREIKDRIPMPNGGSTHSGAFVAYESNFDGQVLSDQNGLHGPALEKKRDLLGVTESAANTNNTDGTNTTAGETVEVEITMGDSFFEPNEISITEGQTLRLTVDNTGVLAHNAWIYPPTGNQELVGTELLAASEQAAFTWTAGEPGDYRLQCTIHPEMRGVVHVTKADG